MDMAVEEDMKVEEYIEDIEDEDVEEERLYVIIVINWDILLGIAQILVLHVGIVM